jgi:hypothetical protein
VTGDNPLFLVGAARSGTSLLYRLLCQHPDVTYINQYVRRAPALPQLAALNRVPRAHPDWQERTWFSETGNAYVYGQRRGRMQRAFPQPVEGEPFFQRWGLPPAVAPGVAEHWDPHPLQTGVQRLRRADGDRRLVSKRINHNRRIAALARAFPGARFVHLVRDGRAAARSLTRVDWWPQCDVWALGTTPQQWAKSGGDPWELAVRHWAAEVSAVDEGLKGVPDDRVLVRRYEDLVADLPGQLAELAGFAHLTVHPEWLERIPALGQQPPAAAAGALTDAQLEMSDRWQAELLDRHGYALQRGD